MGESQPRRSARVEVIYFDKKRTTPLLNPPADAGEPPTELLETAALTPKQGAQRRRKTARLTPRVDTDPALAYHRGKVWKLLSSRYWLSEPEGAARTQIAELSLYGHHLFEQGKLKEARDIFERLVAFEIDEAFPYTMLGTIYLALGDGARALALFEAALRIDPSDVAALVYRGEIRISGGKLSAGTRDLERARALAPQDDPLVKRATRLIQLAEGARRRRAERGGKGR